MSITHASLTTVTDIPPFFELLATLLLSSFLPVYLQPIFSFEPKSPKNLPTSFAITNLR
jgi:hypothetical protein